MQHAQRIRKLVSDTFDRLGVDSSTSFEETVLIRDGYYCGRRYRRDGWQAVWFAEENQIKIFDRDGVVKEVFSQDEATGVEQLRVA